jgi:hypothetical protein
MKERIICLFLVFFVFEAKTQHRHFFEEGARWVYVTEESYEPGQLNVYSNLEEYTLRGDTVLQGVLYKKLYKRIVHYYTVKPPFPHPSTTTTGYGQEGPFFIRADENEPLVYYKVHVDSIEKILYRFDLKTGDTLSLFPDYGKFNVVQKKDSITFAGVTLSMFLTDTLQLPQTNGIIEGIGGLNGLLDIYPYFLAVSGGILMKQLICFRFQGETYRSPFAEFSMKDCYDENTFIVSAEDILAGRKEVTVFPNPGQGQMTVVVPEHWKGGELLVYNSSGLCVLSEKLTSSAHEIFMKKNGLYFYHIRLRGQNVFLGKFVVSIP